MKELKHPSCRLSEVVKMTAIFDEWSRVHGCNVSWLDLVDALEEDEDLALLKVYIVQHLQAKVGSVGHYSEISDSGLSLRRAHTSLQEHDQQSQYKSYKPFEPPNIEDNLSTYNRSAEFMAPPKCPLFGGSLYFVGLHVTMQ